MLAFVLSRGCSSAGPAKLPNEILRAVGHDPRLKAVVLTRRSVFVPEGVLEGGEGDTRRVGAAERESDLGDAMGRDVLGRGCGSSAPNMLPERKRCCGLDLLVELTVLATASFLTSLFFSRFSGGIGVFAWVERVRGRLAFFCRPFSSSSVSGSCGCFSATSCFVLGMLLAIEVAPKLGARFRVD